MSAQYKAKLCQRNVQELLLKLLLRETSQVTTRHDKKIEIVKQKR